MRRVPSLLPVFALLSTLIAAALPTVAPAAETAPAAAEEPAFVRLHTESGDILLVLYPQLAPFHVGNFLHLVRTGFYDGTRFHRIVEGFVIQGGDPNSKDDDPRNDGQGGPRARDVLDADELAVVDKANQVLAARGYQGLEGEVHLRAEFSPTVRHVRGTLSMARGQDVDSAGSQFFICVAEQPALDGKYTVFGHVVSGLDTVDRIVSAEVSPMGQRDAPAIPVQVIQATALEGTTGLTAAERKAWDALPAALKDVR
jgi:cyclophilin family peptidyl-prolyl cis-trans isomerase